MSKEARSVFVFAIYLILLGVNLLVAPNVFVILFFIAFVALGLARPILILFGAVDLLAALWTAVTLRSSRKA